MANDIWSKYVYGMKDYVFSMDGYSTRILEDIQTYRNMMGIEEDQVEDVYEFMVGDGFWEALVNYQYLIAEGVGLPKGLVGCEFLTSYQVLALLNLDVCDSSSSGSFRS